MSSRKRSREIKFDSILNFPNGNVTKQLRFEDAVFKPQPGDLKSGCDKETIVMNTMLVLLCSCIICIINIEYMYLFSYFIYLYIVFILI